MWQLLTPAGSPVTGSSGCRSFTGKNVGIAHFDIPTRKIIIFAWNPNSDLARLAKYFSQEDKAREFLEAIA